MISILVQLNIGRPQLGHTIIANCIIFETFDPEIFSFLIFFKMRLGLASPGHFVYDFSRKTLLMLYSITDQI